MIARLSALRQRPDSVRVEADLNQLVDEALDRINGMPNVEVMRELQPVPRIFADREQIQSVVTNLVVNARDAVSAGGRIEVRTEQREDRVVLSVVDNGCGMSQAFSEGLVVSSVSDHQEEGARHRPVSIAGDRPSARRRRARRKRSRQGHDVSRELSGPGEQLNRSEAVSGV